MKIYTRTGDAGQTSLQNGQRVAKDDARISAYGTLDELNSLVGLIASEKNLDPEIKNELTKIQVFIFDCSTDVAVPDKKEADYLISKEATIWLENLIDKHSKSLSVLHNFILPGGSKTSAQLHLARTITRRAERMMVGFQKEGKVNPHALSFINRLSDYFFVVARYINHKEDIPETIYSKNN
ncbi:MAG TPA: cob(I)yrinic acid a,c-diamide adenosyltransferase [Candidatus Tetragenococcus pullicola]|nr:cob(I)yrinic acid a,c-diamide adenosyltransferase [Candidatus Tetragenococcus pullicola]